MLRSTVNYLHSWKPIDLKLRRNLDNTQLVCILKSLPMSVIRCSYMKGGSAHGGYYGHALQSLLVESTPVGPTTSYCWDTLMLEWESIFL
jgi:hypothetical protein